MHVITVYQQSTFSSILAAYQSIKYRTCRSTLSFMTTCINLAPCERGPYMSFPYFTYSDLLIREKKKKGCNIFVAHQASTYFCRNLRPWWWGLLNSRAKLYLNGTFQWIIKFVTNIQA